MNIYVSFLNIIHIDFLTLKFIILPILLCIFAPSIVKNNVLNLGFMVKFKTKIIQCSESGFEYYKLLFPDGRCVASGSLDHCWNERDHYERSLAPVQLSLDF